MVKLQQNIKEIFAIIIAILTIYILYTKEKKSNNYFDITESITICEQVKCSKDKLELIKKNCSKNNIVPITYLKKDTETYNNIIKRCKQLIKNNTKQ